MKVLITGSDGFIGRHLRQRIGAYGNARIYGCDLDRDCRDLFRGDDHFDLVFHCAALTGGIEGITTMPAKIGAVNAQLDGALFEWALRTKPGRIVYFSSSCVYPLHIQHRGRILAERDARPWSYYGRPDATYGWVKLSGEVLAASVRDAGIPVSIVRPFAVYGADQETSHVVPMFAQRAVLDSRSFEVWGPGNQTHDFVHVEDCVGAILAMIDQKIDGPVNIGTGVGHSVDDVAVLAMKAAGNARPIHHRLDEPVGVPYRVADATLLHTFYGPTWTLEQGVAEAVATARGH